MKTISKKKFIFSSVAILLVLASVFSFLSRDWYVNSKTKIVELEPIDQFDVGNHHVTVLSYLRFKTTGDPTVIHKEYCEQHGWEFSKSGGASCQYVQDFSLGQWFHITIYKQFSLQTVPQYLSLHEAYSIVKKEP
jgi:hypothetical protein